MKKAKKLSCSFESQVTVYRVKRASILQRFSIVYSHLFSSDVLKNSSYRFECTVSCQSFGDCANRKSFIVRKL